MARAGGVRTRRTQEERSATTRRELVRAAAESIAAVGLNRSTIAVIAAKAGVTSGAIQHHFASRDELLLAVVEEFGKALADDPSAHDTDGDSVSSRVASIVQRYWGLFGSRQFLAVMKIWLGTEAQTPLYREITGQMRWFERRFDREWVELFSDCGATPETIANARHVALAAMRGLAMSLSFTHDRGRTAIEIALLQAMVTGAIEGDRRLPASRRAHQARPAGR
jgi:AcrR family transcriptional regulator